MGEAVNGPGGYFGQNLDAFNDWPPRRVRHARGRRFHRRVAPTEHSLAALGYPETVRQPKLRLADCHPSNRPHVQADLEAARAGQGLLSSTGWSGSSRLRYQAAYGSAEHGPGGARVQIRASLTDHSQIAPMPAPPADVTIGAAVTLRAATQSVPLPSPVR
jgi:hypothetical protein